MPGQPLGRMGLNLAMVSHKRVRTNTLHLPPLNQSPRSSYSRDLSQLVRSQSVGRWRGLHPNLTPPLNQSPRGYFRRDLSRLVRSQSVGRWRGRTHEPQALNRARMM
jgi:hypothetical protein